ncbi:hypothetical protein [Paenibacillus alginolyticus]|nr:hypothetical protein [Paenibacillus alginolyticus]
MSTVNHCPLDKTFRYATKTEAETEMRISEIFRVRISAFQHV